MLTVIGAWMPGLILSSCTKVSIPKRIFLHGQPVSHLSSLPPTLTHRRGFASNLVPSTCNGVGFWQIFG